jgi:hypothetical protein
MSVLLNVAQVSDLLSRNAQIQQIVTDALNSNQWPNGNQVCPTGSSWFGLFSGSPTAIGYNVYDDVYGNITIACDASGVLNYNADTPVATAVMNAPPYVSPTVPTPTGPGCPGWTNITGVNDFLACVGDLGTTLKWGVVAFIGYKVYKELK